MLGDVGAAFGADHFIRSATVAGKEALAFRDHLDRNAAERLRGGGNHNLYLTMPLSVSRMHSLAAFLRLRDPNLFFAGVRG